MVYRLNLTPGFASETSEHGIGKLVDAPLANEVDGASKVGVNLCDDAAIRYGVAHAIQELNSEAAMLSHDVTRWSYVDQGWEGVDWSLQISIVSRAVQHGYL